MLIEAVKKTAEKFDLLRKNSPVVVGVSGGADSLTLLLALKQLSGIYRLRLTAAHVDHGLRRASGRDAAFVRDFCRQQGIPVKVVTLKRCAEKKGSLEEVCRQARFRELCRIAAGCRCKTIALGHTLDDQAETVLMRIIRGSGLYGMAAIKPKREINGFTVIRPLIETQRQDIEVFLKGMKVKPCFDETNAQDIFLRNRVRKYLLPALAAKFNPSIKTVLAHTASTAADDYDFLALQAAREFKRMSCRVCLNRYRRLHPALQKLILRMAISAAQGDTRRITHTHVEELHDLAVNRPVGSIVHLPQGLQVSKLKTRLFLSIKS